MMKTKLILVCVTAFVLALSSIAQARVIDWTETYDGIVDQQQLDYSVASMGALYKNLYEWDREVSMWQEFTAGMSGDLAGISLALGRSRESGSFDLNIYAGVGVNGDLIGTTGFEWSVQQSGLEFWYVFQLEDPVALTAGEHYTFSIENLSLMEGSFNADLSLAGISAANNPYDGSYMHQGYQMAGSSPYFTDPNGDMNTATSMDSPFKTVMAPAPIPEPATMLLLGSGLIGLAAFRRRFKKS